MTQTLRPLRHLPTGPILFCGKLKTNKRDIALKIAYAVATGGVAVGHQTQQGEVLYINSALVTHTLRECVEHIGPPPPGMYFASGWPRVGEGAVEALHYYLREHPLTRLIVFDRFCDLCTTIEPWGYATHAQFANAVARVCGPHPNLSMLWLHDISLVSDVSNGVSAPALAASTAVWWSIDRAERAGFLALKSVGRNPDTEYTINIDRSTL